MGDKHVLVADWFAPDFKLEEEPLKKAGFSLSFSGIDNTSTTDVKRETLKKAIRATDRIDALMFNIAPIDAEVIGLLPDTCRLLQRLGTGLDNVDKEAAARRKMLVRNTPQYCVEEVAVHAASMLMSLHRQLFTTHKRLIGGKWASTPPSPITRLSTLTLGIVGLGRIGRKTAEIMKHMIKEVIYYDPALTETLPGITPVQLRELFARSDMISLHLPLTPETRHMINKDTLALMKPTVIIANAARGGLINAEDLAEALRENRIAGAGLDVFEPEVLPADSPLRPLNNVILTSHTGWYSIESLLDARKEAVQSIIENVK